MLIWWSSTLQNHLHREQTIAAFEAGKHVLLQKPVAATLADAEAIASSRTGESARYRQRSVFKLFRSAANARSESNDRSRMVGRHRSLYARLMHRGGLAVSKQVLAGQANWRASLAETGGGCFIQLAVHYVRPVQVDDERASRSCDGDDEKSALPRHRMRRPACAILEFSNGTGDH